MNRIPRINGISRLSVIAIGLGFVTGIGGCIIVPADQNNQVSYQQPATDTPSYSTPDDQSSGDQIVVEQDTYQPPPPEVVTVYDQDLDPYGQWVEVAPYGRCWRPNNRPWGWQPYTIGHWVYSDYGWVWVSDADEASWGQVTYHYGRWYESAFGWVWVPGTEWGPAWVAWREGGGYCGWAPLPPQAGFGARMDSRRVDQYVPPSRYVYCDERQIITPRVDQHFVQNNVTIINNTTNITNITVVNNHVENHGVPVENVRRATGRDVPREQMETAHTQDEARRFEQSGRPVVYSPPAVEHAEQRRRANPGKSTMKPPPQQQQQPPHQPAPPQHQAQPQYEQQPAGHQPAEHQQPDHQQPAGQQPRYQPQQPQGYQPQSQPPQQGQQPAEHHDRDTQPGGNAGPGPQENHTGGPPDQKGTPPNHGGAPANAPPPPSSPPAKPAPPPAEKPANTPPPKASQGSKGGHSEDQNPPPKPPPAKTPAPPKPPPPPPDQGQKPASRPGNNR